MGFEEGRLRLTGLLGPEVLRQMLGHITPAGWITRRNGGGEVETLDPARHGQVTGSVCDYLSHPALLSDLSLAAAIELSHFAGSVVRLAPARSFTLRHAHFPLALLVNLSDRDFDRWSLSPGDAEVIDLRAGQSVDVPPQSASMLAIDGFFVARG